MLCGFRPRAGSDLVPVVGRWSDGAEVRPSLMSSYSRAVFLLDRQREKEKSPVGDHFGNSFDSTHKLTEEWNVPQE